MENNFIEKNKEENIYIVRFGEVALKGQNKSYFEKLMVQRIRKLLRKFTYTKVKRNEGLVFIRTPKDIPKEDIIKEISKVFGIASISPAIEVNSNMEDIFEGVVSYVKDILKENPYKTFKVEAKRADKNFPVKSPDIARQVGGAILKAELGLKVDVHNPDFRVFVDLRRDSTFIFRNKIKGFGGLPLGSNGKGLVLLSGGIDSPVAAFMMAKRGMSIDALHFHSYPYTSQRAQEKVEELAGTLGIYCSRFKMHIINLLPIQEEIVKNCPEEETTILVRRFMMKIAERVAKEKGLDVLITGESLGQVASQTSHSLVVTDESVKIPVMRPLIAIDKIDIMEVAKDIGTYDISIRPYEDCCTVFLPKHPVTKPKLEKILESEARIDVDRLVEEAVNSMETKEIYPLV